MSNLGCKFVVLILLLALGIPCFGQSNGGEGGSAHPVIMGIILDPTTVIGGDTISGTVQLSGITINPTPMQITFRDGNASVVGDTTIPGGVTYMPIQIKTLKVSATDLETISASIDNDTKTVGFTIVPYGVASVSASAMLGGDSELGVVRLSKPSPAGGTVVSLLSGNPSVATVPSSVTISPGLSAASFKITTSPVASSRTATLYAKFDGTVATTPLQVNAAQLSNIEFGANSVKGGSKVSVTVGLSGKAPAGGTAVTLTATPAGILSNPSTVTVPAGSSSVTTEVATLAPYSVATVALKGSLGSVSKSTTIVVTGYGTQALIGRWVADITSGRGTGEIGARILSQTGNAVSGYFLAAPFSGSIVGGVLKSTFRSGKNTIDVSLSINGPTMKGTAIIVGKSITLPLTFMLKSSYPTSPFTGGPKVKSTAIVYSSTLKEYEIEVTWDRPVGGSWDFAITQGSNTILGYLAADEPNFSYDPTTYTLTMPILASAGLVPGSCKLSLEEPDWTGPVPSWNDPYGAPAWTSLAGVYTSNLNVP